MKTCPLNVYPLTLNFYIAKLGYAGVYFFFLILLQNIDSNDVVYPQSMYRAKLLKIFFFLMKFSIFRAEKNLYILHGRVFVMLDTLFSYLLHKDICKSNVVP